jgi:tripartite-type tricarboxylate transporter receptor subunit TctC
MNLPRRSFFHLATCATALAILFFMTNGHNVLAQTETIKFVVPVPPGGPLDFLARVLAEQIGKTHSRNIIVENRASGGGVVAAQVVAHAAPDGDTVLIHSPSFLIAPQLQDVGYEPFKLFEPICNLVNSPVVIAVNAASPYHTLNDLVDAARAKPRELAVASVGPATPIHLGVEMLMRKAGVDMTYVPFKGDAPAVTALLGQQVTAMFGNYSSLSGHLSEGTIRALAVGSHTRIPALPNVSTVAETGYKDYDVGVWFGAAVPAGTPKERVAELTQWFVDALQTPEITTKLAAQQLISVGVCGSDYAGFLHSQYGTFGQIIHDANITLQ